jgi:glutamate carboxypeptidase
MADPERTRCEPTMMHRNLLTVVAVILLATTSAARAQSLTAEERRVLERVDSNIDAAIELLDRIVSIDSATQNAGGVRRVGDALAGELRALGFTTQWSELPADMRRAGHLAAERRGTRGKRLLLLGHLDTVLEGEPFRRAGGTAYGSGVADMKGGDVVLIYALKALQQGGALDDRQVSVILTGDEESPGEPLKESRRALVDAARRHDIALSFEATFRNTATVARRGASFWTLEVTGSAGHSAGIFGDARGSGAVFETARILTAFHEQLRGEQYLTFNPSVIVGGTDVTFEQDHGTAAGKMNVVPQKVVVRGDLRFISEDQKETVRARMRAIVAQNLPRTSARIQFQDLYPAMAPTAANLDLLRWLDQASRDVGGGEVVALPADERGAGDMSFTAPIIPGLDGLGIRGTGAHAPGESADLASLPLLIKRAALLIYRLTR